jgi:hypothetical protein
LNNFTKEEKNNKLRKRVNYWIHALGTALTFGLNDRVAQHEDISYVVVNCINGLRDDHSFSHLVKHKNRSRGAWEK